MWDGVQCWPGAERGTIATLSCPPYKGFDTTRTVSKVCLPSGTWLPQEEQQLRLTYTACLTKEMISLLKTFDEAGGHQQKALKMSIARGTRLLELLGLTISLFSLAVSLFIFCRLRVLRNSRTRIHVSLFSSMLVHVLVRLLLYLDQLAVRGAFSEGDAPHSGVRGIENTPWLCKAFYVLLEYTRTTMFMWMFIEGLHLYYKLTAFRRGIRFVLYHSLGWGVPVLVTMCWATTTALTNLSRCWFAYNHSSHYWILEGPRLAIITVNLVFLVAIIRVLVSKLRGRPDCGAREAAHVRKAVKAALILLPLLGITNVANMVAAPIHRSALEFGLWSFGSHFLSSFQGFFVALLYCFLNDEVQDAVKKHMRDRLEQRQSPAAGHTRRESNLSSTRLVTSASCQETSYASLAQPRGSAPSSSGGLSNDSSQPEEYDLQQQQQQRDGCCEVPDTGQSESVVHCV